MGVLEKGAYLWKGFVQGGSMTGKFRCIRVNPSAGSEGPQEATEEADGVTPTRHPGSSPECDCGGDLGHRKRGSGSGLWVCSSWGQGERE